MKKEKEKSFNKAKVVVKDENIDWWDEISDAEKASIKRGLIDAKIGRVV